MPKLTIDGKEVEVAPGATVLQAAHKLGIDIPTLCFYEGRRPQTACLVCLVKVNGNPNLVPSCAMPAQDGMKIDSETEDVRAMRKAALELILSDHLGDCEAPCNQTCPAHMQIPQMLRQVAAGKLRDALVTIKRDIAMPAVLGRICPEVCERTCRRGSMDHPAAICMVKRYVADADLSGNDRYVPAKRPSTGKRVGVIGAGPAGLAAASYLLQYGHAVVILDANEKPGGTLRYSIGEEKLPRAVIDGEVATVLALGGELRMNTRVERVQELLKEFDAVFLATGNLAEGDAEKLGIVAPALRFPANVNTLETKIKGLFAGGDLVRRRKLAIRSVADGKIAALSITQYLAGRPITGEESRFTSKLGKLDAAEARMLSCGSCNFGDRHAPCGGASTGLSGSEAKSESERCLHCDCRKADDCRLRDYADAYGCVQSRYKGTQRTLEPLREGPHVIYEPGKCIACGLCVQIASDAQEELGLTYIGRGFNVHIGVPFDGTLDEGLRKTAKECCLACPTGALALRDETVLRRPDVAALTALSQPVYAWEKR